MVDIGIILIRSTLMMCFFSFLQFCHDMVKFAIENTSIILNTKKGEGKYFPPSIWYIQNLYN